MFQVGEHVLYGIHGVCRITATEERTVDRKRVSYLVLEPLEQAGARYLIPTHNEAALSKLRPVMSRQQLEQLLSSDEVRFNVWIEDENLRKQRYRELISSGDRLALLQMICSLHNHKKAQSEAGRKFHLCDENFLRDAERLLNEEFSLVLGIEQNLVSAYVCNALLDEPR